MQIVGKPEKLKSREPLILLGLRLVIQVVLPLGSIGEILAGSSPVTRTISSVHNQLEGWKWTLDFFLSVK